MWDKLKKYLGYAWAAPLTLPALIYVGTFALLDWYRWYGVRGDALVWTVNKKVPSWLTNRWTRWGGHAIGNVVVLKNPPDEKSMFLKHEQKHVDQMMKMGLFWPVVYFGNMLAIFVGCPGSDPYYDNPLEIDARRYSGQLIDIIGMRNKLIVNSKKRVS